VNRGSGSFPAEVTSFVGRRQATDNAKRALSLSRLLTLTGVGGTGKSRLARHVARQVWRAFPDGVWLVELGKLRDPSLVGDVIATALGLTDQSSRDPQTVLVGYLADKQLLLVLDNCEHLLDECAVLVARLLSVAPGLRVLATSREPLGIAGERVCPVSPLSVPRLGEVLERQYEALVLFEERAAAVVPGFAVNEDNQVAVARLCQRLDGLPLAIELAAVRLRSLSVHDILDRLEDRFRLLTTGDRVAPERHQTLRAAVEWSFELCTRLERTLWARLSVFAGEFDMAAAEEVCAGEGLLVDEVLTGVIGLVEKSVLVAGSGSAVFRYRMLETIRQYGREHLSDEDELVVRGRHRDYHLRLCERAEADWFGPRQGEWLDRFQAEEPNLWAALEFCLSQPGQARAGLRMVGALHWYWLPRAIRYGRRWVDRALACDGEPSPERAKALWVDGWIAAAQGDTEHALSVLAESAELARGFDDETGLGHAMRCTGLAHFFQGDLAASAAALDQALAHYRSVGAVDSLTASALCIFGTVVAMQGDAERAVALCEECIEICQARGESWARAMGLLQLTFVRFLQGDLTQVSVLAKEAVQLASALREQFGVAWCVQLLAWVASIEGDARRAAVLFGMNGRMWEEIGLWLSGWRAAGDLSDHYRAQVREALGQRVFDARVEQGRRFTADEGLAYAVGEQSSAPVDTSAVPPVLAQLTRREREVAMLVAQGMSNKDIAAALVVAKRTAEAHVENILNKLSFTSRSQIATWIAEQQG